MFNDIFSRLRIQPINLDDATPSVRTHKKYVNMPVIVIIVIVIVIVIFFRSMGAAVERKRRTPTRMAASK